MMFKIIKKRGSIIYAYRLGTESEPLSQLMMQGLIQKREDKKYEIFSQESVHGVGEIASEGDYIKVDSKGFPYPNTAEFFEQNHCWIAPNQYEQIPTPLDAWTVNEKLCDEIHFLIKEKGLILNEGDPSHYFTAPLWGTIESAGKDAVLVFYRIDRDTCGRIIDADFNFISRDEFEKTYICLDEK